MIDTEVLTEIENEKVQAEEMPTFNHSVTCARITKQLSKNESIEALPELTLAIGNGLTPDISVYPTELIQPDFFQDITRFETPPLLAIEVISPSQNIQDLLQKAKTLTEAGSKTVWTIEPFTRSIFVTTKNGTQLLHNTTVESEGITVDFVKVFGG